MTRSTGVVQVLAVFTTEEDRISLRRIFHRYRWKVRFVRNRGGLESALARYRADVVMADSDLGDGQGWRDILSALDQDRGNTPLIVSSLLADDRLWAEVLNLGGYDLLRKPFEPEEVAHVVTTAAGHVSDEAQALRIADGRMH